MQFTDFTFIFIFIPVFFLIFFLLPSQFKAVWIFLGSAFFYFWAEPLFFWVLSIQITINFIFAVFIDRTRTRVWLSKALLVIVVLVDLGLMILLRDSTVLLRMLNIAADTSPDIDKIFFPLGISFITFSLLSYVIDISKGSLSERWNLFQFANYILFFPKVQQGPIQDFTGFQKSIAEINTSSSNLYIGISRFIQGLAKKVLIADSLASVADSVFSANLTHIGFSLSWYGLISFALQIYFDFSGYTDMAIGIATALGVSLPENFNSPYSCMSVADFWRRWHMTLTAWFRKYVFFPLEFRFRKLGVIRQPLNLLIVFFLTGAWHGINPNFLVWGGYYGLILALESMGLGRWLKRLPRFFQHFYALLLVLFGWVFFRLKTPDKWGGFFQALFGMNGLSGNATARTLNLLGYLPIVIIAIILCIPVPKTIDFSNVKVVNSLTVVIQIALLILSIAFLVEGGYQSFLYRQF